MRKIKIKKKLIGQLDIITQVAKLIKDAKYENGMSMYDWIRVLFDMHKKGMLYVNVNENKVNLAIGCYRVKEVPKIEDEFATVPEKEEGDIFYIPFYVPRDKPLPIGKVRRFFKARNEIASIVFENDDKQIKEYKMFKKEKTDGKEENRHTETADVSA